MDNRSENSIETRLIQPCMEFIEKLQRMKDRTKRYDKYLKQKRVELERLYKGGVIILPRITVIVGTRCTLCCRDCSNLMQNYLRPYDIEIDSLLEDLYQLFLIVEYCECINIIGGEPFIYPYLDRLLEYLIHNEKVGYIEFTTNGTKIPDEKVLELLANDKVYVEISDYGEIDKLAKFITIMDKYHAKVHMDVNMRWIDCGGNISRNRDDSVLKELYGACRAGKLCKALFKGRLFDCPRAAHLNDLGFAGNIDYLDIYSCDKTALLDFWLKEYSMACDYCDMMVQDKKFVEPAIQKNGRHLNRSSCTIIPREDYEEILEANEWYRQQLGNYQQRVSELEEWTAELQKSKDWLEMQYKQFTEVMK